MKKSWLWETKIYVWQFRSCVQFRCRWQAIIWAESRLQNAGFKWCNLKSSVLKYSWHFSNCFANSSDDGSYTVFTASCEWSFSKLKLVLSNRRASFVNNKSGKVMWYSFDENRKGRNSKSLLWWNHRRICLDKN